LDEQRSLEELVGGLSAGRVTQYQLAIEQVKVARPFIVAIDPGRANLLTAYVSWIIELRRVGYYEMGGINRRNRLAAKWQRPLRDIDAMLLFFPKHTTYPLFIRARRLVMTENWDVIWRNALRMDRAQVNFTCQARKASVIDTHLAQYTPANVSADQVEVVYGSGTFAATGKSERAAPVVHVYKRCKAMYKQTIQINEAYTTKVHYKCHERLAPAVGKTGRDTQLGKAAHVLRGLKVCRHCRHYVSRDSNAARGIYTLYIHQLVCGQGSRPAAFAHYQPYQADPLAHTVGEDFLQGGGGDGDDDEEEEGWDEVVVEEEEEEEEEA